MRRLGQDVTDLGRFFFLIKENFLNTKVCISFHVLFIFIHQAMVGYVSVLGLSSVALVIVVCPAPL